jgi:hypothetical protein
MAKRKGRVPGLATAVNRRLSELDERDEQLSTLGDQGIEATAVRCQALGAALSSFLAANEDVKIPAVSWEITESAVAKADNVEYTYEVQFAVSEEGRVWSKNIMLSSLESNTFPYRWTARHGEQHAKFDRFVDAVVFAKTERK